jgi:rhodanese-related sulfurtransferase
VQDEPGQRGALTDAAVGDGVLGQVDALLGVELLELVVRLEGAVVVGVLGPRDVAGARDVARTLRLLLRQVRGGEQLAGELVGRADVDQVLGPDRGDDLIAERADGEVGLLGLVLGGRALDGGRKKWELDSRDLVAAVPQRPATEYKAKAQNTAIRAFRDDVVAAIGTLNLVDVRSPDEFSGKLLAPAHLPQEQSQRPGHVPSARNIPWSKNANDDGTFKSDAELVQLYQDENVDLAKDTIAYCRIGERSALTWFVLHELLDQDNVKNYDGSWTEYGSLVGVPIELGAN